MEVPAFPLPPSPLETTRVAPSTVRHIPHVASAVTGRLRHVLPGKHRRTNPPTAVVLNSLPKRRAHRLARLANSVHPQVISRDSSKHNRIGARVTEFHVKMTERREDEEDDGDVVCASGTPVSFESRTISEDLSVDMKDDVEPRPRQMPRIKSTGVQTHFREGPYRLRVFPTLKDTVISDANGNPKTTSRIWRLVRFLARLSLCQFGLAWLLTFWTIAGAAAFYATEGPREQEQVLQLKDLQKDLAVGLATELRQLKATEKEMEPLWSNKVRQYVVKHEKLLLQAVSSGYGEGGNSGQLWTFPGCFLFAISLITTLGFGAPVPRTTPGRIVAVIFASIGIPLHFLLILNVGLLLAVRLQTFSISRKYKKDPEVCSNNLKAPRWVKFVPFICIAGYYIIGIFCFGVARTRPVAASLLFPLDFTAAGGLAMTSGIVRIFYGVYLEGAVTIAAFVVAVLQVSATESLTNIGLKYGLLTEA